MTAGWALEHAAPGRVGLCPTRFSYGRSEPSGSPAHQEDDDEETTPPLNPQPSTLNSRHSSLHPRLCRLVRRHIDRLHHRKENFLLRNEPDLARVVTDDGETISPLETIPAPDITPIETLTRAEDDAETEKFKTFLGRERRLKALLECLRDGEGRPKALARKLRLRPLAIQNLRKRLKRRSLEFFATEASHRPKPQSNGK